MGIGMTGTVVVAAAVAGAAGAGAAFLAGAVGGSTTSTPGAPDPRVATLEQRLEEQTEQVRALKASLDELRSARFAASGPGGRRAPRGPGEEPELPGDGADTEIAGSLSAGGPPATEEEAEQRRRDMLQVYSEQKAKDEAERAAARAATEEAQIRGRLDRLPENLALSEAQKAETVRILKERREKTQAAFAEARKVASGPEAFRAAQEQMPRIREEATAALSAILTPEQMKAVETIAAGGGAGRRAEGTGPEGVGRRRAGAMGGRREGATGPAGGSAPTTPEPPK
jgi:hypothetical protein